MDHFAGNSNTPCPQRYQLQHQFASQQHTAVTNPGDRSSSGNPTDINTDDAAGNSNLQHPRLPLPLPLPPSEHNHRSKDGNSVQSASEKLGSGTRRRNINSSKRAAQNRAAQRAFRLRRERYVAGLEEKARDYERLETAYHDLQRENYQLRTSLHKIQVDNATLRAYLAASAPVSPLPPPPSASAQSVSPPIPTTVSHAALGPHHSQNQSLQQQHFVPNSSLSAHSAPLCSSYYGQQQYSSSASITSMVGSSSSRGGGGGGGGGGSSSSHRLSPGSQQYPRPQPAIHQSHLRRGHSLQHLANPQSPPVQPISSNIPNAAYADIRDTASQDNRSNTAGTPESTHSNTTSMTTPSTNVQMLPSVREITMSVGSMFTVRPQPPPLADNAAITQLKHQTQQLARNPTLDIREKEEYNSSTNDMKRRPW